MKEQNKPESIGAYIAGFPEDIREILQTIRETIQQTAPEAKEAITYQIPTFKLNGNLVHFAAFKQHIGFYPSPSAIVHFSGKLAGYETSKGTIKFPLNKPIPYDLIQAIVKYRVQDNKK